MENNPITFKLIGHKSNDCRKATYRINYQSLRYKNC
jgi:hypothetical protein